MNYKTWWLEAASLSSNLWKLFQLIRPTGSKTSGFGKVIYDVDSMSFGNILRRLIWCTVFRKIFRLVICPRLSHPPWLVTIDLPNEEEVHIATQIIRLHESPGLDDLPSLFLRRVEKVYKKTIPTSWSKAAVVPNFNRHYSCMHSKGISLLLTASKLLNSVIFQILLNPWKTELYRTGWSLIKLWICLLYLHIPLYVKLLLHLFQVNIHCVCQC